MLTKILGTISVLMGLLWLMKPEALKNRVKKKMNRKLMFIVYGFIIVFGFMIIGSVIGTPGLLPKIIGIAGMIIDIKGILMLTRKGSGKITDWLQAKPLLFFRAWALFIITIGIMLILA